MWYVDFIWKLTVILLLLIAAGIGKAIMDVTRFRFATSVFAKYVNSFWVNPEISWRNKYKNRDPQQGEAFPGSTTIFVFVTDLWHFSQFIFLRCILFVPVFYALFSRHYTTLSGFCGLHHWSMWIVDYVFLSAVFGLTFTLFYSIVFKKK